MHMNVGFFSKQCYVLPHCMRACINDHMSGCPCCYQYLLLCRPEGHLSTAHCAGWVVPYPRSQPQMLHRMKPTVTQSNSSSIGGQGSSQRTKCRSRRRTSSSQKRKYQKWGSIMLNTPMPAMHEVSSLFKD